MEKNMYIIVIFIIAVTLFKIFLPQIKGWLGEKTVSAVLTTLPKEDYRTINDVMLRTEHGTSQIDHVIVSIYGIFVIETKNYKGWITGTENSQHWTKNMYGKKYPFRNPIKQNYGHVKALEKLLGLPYETFIPIVVFSVHADLKINTISPVVYMSQLAKEIRRSTDIKIQREDLGRLVSKILAANINSKENRKKHVQEIHTTVQKERQLADAGICPKCGGMLKVRKGKYGMFLDCSNYPKCRYTRDDRGSGR